ncbi:tyrosinase family protein [Streptomyces yaizuensis]|uniref:Tyrosinase family protein n=1 Tax=Streptomyces yaizuensis TaxID=2989713 RepID=A0ABQ5PAJ6_9ACTN|nr:tyrosinase family protein [Streptomyces sp. YSPA8]GLF99610.1 tyrosinase family protein [Streptomyces sp. YSPA8]
MSVRKNQADLTAAERKAFVDAVLELKRIGKYDPFVTLHRNIFMVGPEPVAHGSPSFLSWHRKYLIDFEDALKSIDPAVSLPYWDWTVDRTPASSLWAPDFLGGTGRELDWQVMDGPFAHSGGRWPITVQAMNRPFLSRHLGRWVNTLPTRAEVDAALASPVYDAAPWNGLATSGFRNALEDLHNLVHVWVGGDMNFDVSPNDPVFWLHHCFVDKLWSDWQKRYPGASYLPAGNTPGVLDVNEPMHPWTTTAWGTLDHAPYYSYA